MCSVPNSYEGNIAKKEMEKLKEASFGNSFLSQVADGSAQIQ